MLYQLTCISKSTIMAYSKLLTPHLSTNALLEGKTQNSDAGTNF